MNDAKKKLTPKQNLMQVIKFVAFSLGAGIIQTITFALLNEVAELAYYLSYFTALVLSVLYNFTVNRKFTFKSAANVPIAMLKVALYYCVFTPISTYGGTFFTNLGVNEYIVLGVTMLINVSTEFLFCRFVVYRKSINTNTLGQRENDHEKSRANKTIQ